MRESSPSISENEWFIMEVLWESRRPCTSTEIIDQLSGRMKLSPQTIRVMLNRLVKKEAVAFAVDKKNAGLYHYYPLCTREECRREKNRRFTKAFFNNNPSLMIASMVEDVDLSGEELDQLIGLLSEKRNSFGETHRDRNEKE